VSLPWQWQHRAQPLAAQAAVAWGEVAPRLHARLVQLPLATCKRLTVAASDGLLMVIGATADLPWVEGIEYAAPDPDALGLWLPTRWQPQVPAEWLLQALGTRVTRRPLLLWREPARVIPLDRQWPLAEAGQLAHIQSQWGRHAAS